jgi:outer membrane protein assembly factor BamB
MTKALLLMAFLSWPQLGHDATHNGTTTVPAQPIAALLTDFIHDPFTERERNDEGDLQNHYAVPLVDGNEIFMATKSGTFFAAPRWETQIWGVTKLKLTGSRAETLWMTTTDWKPVPGNASDAGGPQLEPLFQPALAGDFLYMPGAGGSVLQVRRADGVVAQRITPFGPTIDATIFVSGPLVADADGNIVYNALQLDSRSPWSSDARGAWLVRIAPDGTSKMVTYQSIVLNAPGASDGCTGVFSNSELPGPPTPGALAPLVRCGPQRPGVNVAPAIAPDGTIYTMSRAHLNSRWSYLVALNHDLSPKWSASLRDRFNDGCNVLLPPNGTAGGCREGAMLGVDPSDNTRGAGRVIDDSSSSPVVAPDGSVIYGAFTRYNYDQGHLMHFSATGTFLGSYYFGWDITPAVRAHDGTYSIVTKENLYDERGSYCDDPVFCPVGRDEDGYFVTQLDASLRPEWKYLNDEEWCVSAPAIDGNGVVLVNSEDGFLYALNSDGSLRQKLFLQENGGGAYTPLAIDGDGRVYAQNGGHLFVVGGGRRRTVAAP